MNSRKEVKKGAEHRVVIALGFCSGVLEAVWPRATIPLM